MKKAILYTRVENGNQKSGSEEIVTQELELRKYCEKNQIEVINVIHEYAPGKDFNRPEFTSLHLAIRKGELKPDLLLFTSIYVFSENVADVLKMHHSLLKFGVTTKALREIQVVFVGIKNDGKQNGKI
jgi:DNA invertase Pin-like site-specific DNA recombinase